MSLFKICIDLINITMADAAKFLDVREDTIKKWCQGKTTPPAGVWDQINFLYNNRTKVDETELLKLRDLYDEEIN